MQQNVQIRTPCQRVHQRGQEEVNSVCLNKDCQIRLACNNCLIEGLHQDHLAEVCHFDHLSSRFQNDIVEYQQSGILNLIDKRKKEFRIAISNVQLALQLLENDYLKQMESVMEINKQITESIQMIQKKDFIKFRESNGRYIVNLKYGLVQSLKGQLKIKLIEEVKNLEIKVKGMSRVEQEKEFLKSVCKDDILIQAFQKSRLSYALRKPQQIDTIPLIFEEQIGFLDQKLSFYFGSFINKNIKHGRGIQVLKDQKQIYEGIWINNNMKWGQKIEKGNSQNFQIIQGYFQKGQAEGYVFIRYPNGSLYEGEYENDQRGEGILKYSNGDSFQIVLRNNERHEIFRYANGDTFQKTYIIMKDKQNRDCDRYYISNKNYKKEGHGIYTYSNGDVYDGEYLNDLKEGEGRYQYSNGDIFEGKFKKDKKQGYGTYIYSNGDQQFNIYFSNQGEYKDGEPFGPFLDVQNSRVQIPENDLQ